MSKEKKGFKINPFGSAMLVIVLVSMAAGAKLGIEYARSNICGDISFYHTKDKDLVGTRGCEGIIAYTGGN